MEACSSLEYPDGCENSNLLEYVRLELEDHGDNGSEAYSTLVVSSAGFYFGFCALISHILLAGITSVVAYKCISLKMEHTAGHAFYCTVAVSIGIFLEQETETITFIFILVNRTASDFNRYIAKQR